MPRGVWTPLGGECDTWRQKTPLLTPSLKSNQIHLVTMHPYVMNKRDAAALTIRKEDLVAAKERPEVIPAVRVRPRVHELFDDVYCLLAEELRLLRAKVGEGEALDQFEATKLVRYADAVAKIAREERAQELHDDPANYSDSLLKMLAKDADEEAK